MKMPIRLAALLLLISGLYLGNCSSPHNANNSNPRDSLSTDQPLFLEGLWIPKAEFDDLVSGMISKRFRFGFPDLYMVQTSRGIGGGNFMHGGAYWGDESPALHACGDGWCRGSGLHIGFSINQRDTSATLYDLQGGVHAYQHIPLESKSNFAGGSTTQSDTTGFRHSESDWAYRYFYFAGQYRVDFLNGGASKDVTLESNGTVTSESVWHRFSLLTQHNHPVFVLIDRSGKQTFYSFQPDENDAFSFSLSAVQNSEDLSDGEGASIQVGPKVMQFVRK
jgi:hypothetical protein